MTYPNDIDPSMSFVGGFMMKDPQATMLLVANRREDTCELDRVLGWTYKENVVGLLFRGHNAHEFAVRLLFTSENCAEFVRKLTDLLQKRDSS